MASNASSLPALLPPVIGGDVFASGNSNPNPGGIFSSAPVLSTTGNGSSTDTSSLPTIESGLPTLTLPNLNSPATPANTGNSSILGGLGNILGGAVTGNTGAIANGAAQLGASGTSILNLSLGRIGVFALGLICIGGAIFLFGRAPISEAVGTATKAAIAV